MRQTRKVSTSVVARSSRVPTPNRHVLHADSVRSWGEKASNFLWNEKSQDGWLAVINFVLPQLVSGAPQGTKLSTLTAAVAKLLITKDRSRLRGDCCTYCVRVYRKKMLIKDCRSSSHHDNTVSFSIVKLILLLSNITVGPEVVPSNALT